MNSLLTSDNANAHPVELRARVLLMSVRPRFASAILSGSKTVKLRRTRPNVDPGSLVLLYSSSPVKALVGWARLKTIVEGTPDWVWRNHQGDAGISDSDFEIYFSGASTAFALLIQ